MGERLMPEKETIERAREDKQQGKAASTQAGEFVREEIHHVREASMVQGQQSKQLQLAFRRRVGPG